MTETTNDKFERTQKLLYAFAEDVRVGLGLSNRQMADIVSRVLTEYKNKIEIKVKEVKSKKQIRVRYRK